MNKNTGFTLIEVMIVVVIVAILAAIAVPSYQDSIRKTRRADAKETLTAAAARQERYFFTNNAYATDVADLGVSGGESTDGHYTIRLADPDNMDTSVVSCKSGSVYPCYKLQASAKLTGPQANDTRCRTFTITQTGKKQALASDNTTDTTDECWN